MRCAMYGKAMFFVTVFSTKNRLLYLFCKIPLLGQEMFSEMYADKNASLPP